MEVLNSFSSRSPSPLCGAANTSRRLITPSSCVTLPPLPPPTSSSCRHQQNSHQLKQSARCIHAVAADRQDLGPSRPASAPLVPCAPSPPLPSPSSGPQLPLPTSYAEASSAGSSTAPAKAQEQFRFRRCRLEDVPAVASICGQAFGFGNFPGIDVASLNELEQRYAVSIEREVNVRLAQALQKKAEAQAEHRLYRLQRQYQLMQAQLSSLRMMRAVYPGPESPRDLRAVQKWKRARMFCCMLAVDASSGEVLGCVNMSIMQPEAILPPPLPSTSPLRFYVSNMAVASSHRRQGLAAKLLAQCTRVGRLWGWGSAWLHVSALNTPAQALYLQAGFTVVDEGLLTILAGPFRQRLMSRELLPLRQGSSSSVAASAVSAGGDDSGRSTAGLGSLAVGGRPQDSRVYLWGAEVEASEAADGGDEQATRTTTL